MDVAAARALMHDWVSSEALRNHMEAVAACVASYARELDPEAVEDWTVCGLLHDFDYERNPSPDEHPYVGVAELERLGVDEHVRTAILGHADYTGTPRTTPLAKTLFACDELAGFIVACCKLRPNGIGDLTPKSVRKKLKDKTFAAAVSRRDIDRGVAELAEVLDAGNLDELKTKHIQHCIDALRSERERLGL